MELIERKTDIVMEETISPEEGYHKPAEGSSEPLYSDELVKRSWRKIDLMLMPMLLALNLFASLDKANLGNAKQLGMMKDLGHDPKGLEYAKINALYFALYAPLMIPAALLGKRTRLSLLLCCAAIIWGTAATSFAGAHNYNDLLVCRLFVGAGEAGFIPVMQLYMSRFYTRQALGSRVCYWLSMSALGGFINGIVAYGVAHIHSKVLASWRILYLIEGSMTLLLGILAFFILPEKLESCHWLKEDEREYLIYMRTLDQAGESNHINWKHALGTFYRWQSLLPACIDGCAQIISYALSAYLPTLMADIGFEGANAQIATLAPYGVGMISMIIGGHLSDRYRNRGWPIQLSWLLTFIAFIIYLTTPQRNHGARFAALILAEMGHYIGTPLIVTWAANNAGNESRRAVAVAFVATCAQCIAVGSGYLFPAKDAPRYRNGSIACVSLALGGMMFTGIYQFLIWRENRRRDKREGGPPPPGFRPDTETYCDDAPGFRYFG